MTDREYVERGVAWLDEHAPSDWLYRIDLDELDISSCHHCVLGQVFRAEAEEEPDYGSGFGYALGKYKDLFDSGSFVGLEVMTELWREKIRALREERREAPVTEEERELVLA